MINLSISRSLRKRLENYKNVMRPFGFWIIDLGRCPPCLPVAIPEPPPAPPPPPPFSPPPPPPNTVNGHKYHKIDCRKLSWETLSPDLLNKDTIWKKVGSMTWSEYGV